MTRGAPKISAMDLARRRNWDYRPGHRRPYEEAFWEKVFPEPNTGCWLWGGAEWRGYGTFSRSPMSGTRAAHRIAYELTVGPIPPGLHIDHLCRQTYCVRPDHLEPVTPRTNLLRGRAPNILVRGTGVCRRGHPQTEKDRRAGRAWCHQCNRHREAVKRRERGVPEGNWQRHKETCPLGHPYDMVKAGARRCRRCVNDQTNARRAAKRAALKAVSA